MSAELRNGWWYVATNRWNADRYTKDQAEKCAAKLIGCSDCSRCSDCYDNPVLHSRMLDVAVLSLRKADGHKLIP